MNKNDVFDLVKLFTASGLTYMEFDDGGSRLRLENGRTGGSIPAGAPLSAAAAESADATAGANAFAVHASDDPAPSGEYVTSPLVGTFYRAPAADAAPFAEQGAIVEAGDTLCIIEAMKVMNEIPAPFRCRILRVLAADGAMAECGEKLFEIEKC